MTDPTRTWGILHRDPSGAWCIDGDALELDQLVAVRLDGGELVGRWYPDAGVRPSLHVSFALHAPPGSNPRAHGANLLLPWANVAAVVLEPADVVRARMAPPADDGQAVAELPAPGPEAPGGGHA